MTVAVICSALLGLLLMGLGFAVSTARGRHEKLIGHSPDPLDPVHKIVRAHGNTAEYAPMLAVLMLLAARFDPADWVLWVMAIGTAARFAIVIGLMIGSLEKPNAFRFAGAALTYLAGIVLSVNILVQAF